MDIMRRFKCDFLWCTVILVIIIFSEYCKSDSIKSQTEQYPIPNYGAAPAAYQSQVMPQYGEQQGIGNILGKTIVNSINGSRQGMPLNNILGSAVGSLVPAVLPYQTAAYMQQPEYERSTQASAIIAPNSPKKDAADELELQMAQRKEIIKQNPFFQLSSNSMKIRELATQNPDLLKQIGVFIVKIKPEEAFSPEEQKEHEVAQGAIDAIEGAETPCAAFKKKEDQEAAKELEIIKNSDKQKFLLKSMDPTQQAAYLDRQKAALKKAIRTQKNNLERAKEEMRRLAKQNEQ